MLSKELKSSFQAPSNIALVKYWGKHGDQLPNNASVSFTLSKSVSKFELKAIEKSENTPYISLNFEGKSEPKFADKIQKYFNKIQQYYPILNEFNWLIESSNTFPHSSGIASSASSMAALALCVEKLQHGSIDYQRASKIARLGSGSACRSVYPKLAWWGYDSFIEGSSDDFAIPVWEGVDPVFYEYQNAILIIASGEKAVSSSAGHELMNGHPYEQTRYKKARQNIEELYIAMQHGDLIRFGEIIEEEALTLHALMMLSNPSFILLKPNTLAAIEKIKNYRADTKIPLYFTIDAGPNLHLLYPKSYENQVVAFIDSELKLLCENQTIIYDEVGNGPIELN